MTLFHISQASPVSNNVRWVDHRCQTELWMIYTNNFIDALKKQTTSSSPSSALLFLSLYTCYWFPHLKQTPNLILCDEQVSSCLFLDCIIKVEETDTFAWDLNTHLSQKGTEGNDLQWKRMDPHPPSGAPFTLKPISHSLFKYYLSIIILEFLLPPLFFWVLIKF